MKNQQMYNKSMRKNKINTIKTSSNPTLKYLFVNFGSIKQNDSSHLETLCETSIVDVYLSRVIERQLFSTIANPENF